MAEVLSLERKRSERFVGGVDSYLGRGRGVVHVFLRIYMYVYAEERSDAYADRRTVGNTGTYITTREATCGRRIARSICRRIYRRVDRHAFRRIDQSISCWTCFFRSSKHLLLDQTLVMLVR